MLPSNVLVYFARGCFSFFVGLGAYRGAPFPTTGRGLGDPRHAKSRQGQQGGVPWLRSPDQLGRGAACKAGEEGHARGFYRAKPGDTAPQAPPNLDGSLTAGGSS